MTSPRFRFGLERVRELRAHDEDQAKEAFASSVQERLRGAALLAAASQELEGARAQHRDRTAAPDASASGRDLIAMQQWLERVEQSRLEAERELEMREALVAARREEMTEAAQRRQALERLKAQRKAQHATALARQEAVFLDEIALSQHVRRGAA